MQIEWFDYAQVLPPFGFQLPTRMTALALDGGLALISPIPIDDALARKLSALGEVRYLIAPNLLHSTYLEAARARYPEAKLLAPRGLSAKKPALRIDAALEDGLPFREVELIPIAGAPRVDEFAFFADGTLIVTDLVFNVVRPRGWFTHLALALVGCRGRLAMSRTWRVFARDRAATSASVQRLLALPIETLVMAHGEVVQRDAHARLTEAVRWLLPARRALPA
jgi:hypothetical protein